ncbi:hypothetical protein VHEMI07980 [[Torrubiella] hemipterigena]|uniref:Beta-lactamase-related domain-containing protein n=1 Tax=[Torrubiella] hemipterigena TaxID=1531966 RepID=A0A0A1TMD3_9HYPO|nr:hypothetical protein VHEMI07980 [[Torrubiella] hemipterigena]
MSSNNIFDEIDAFLVAGKPSGTTPANVLAELGATSVSLAVLDGGKITSRCYSNYGYNEQTVYQAASISKAINSLAVMRLVEQGRLALTSTVKDVLPQDLVALLTEGSPAAQRPLIEGITVKQLLSHTAGLSVSGIHGNTGDEDLPTTKESIAGSLRASNPRVRQVELPGTTYRYSGGGITVLQAMMETVTGHHYPDLMRELVLEPLGMARSWYGVLPQDEENAASVYVTALQPFPIKHFNFPTMAAAGLWTTPSDLLRAIAAVQASLDGEEGAFLKQDTARAMLEEVDSDVALSWFLKKDENDKPAWFSHSGHNYPGFFSLVIGSTDHLGSAEMPKNCGVAFMTNSEDGANVGHMLAVAVAHRKGWPMSWVRKTWSMPLGLSGQLAGSRWKAWEGVWTDKDGKHTYEMKALEGGEPGLVFDGVGSLQLVPAAGRRLKKENGYEEFVVEGMEVVMTLEEEKDGGEKVVKLSQDAGTVELTRAK